MVAASSSRTPTECTVTLPLVSTIELPDASSMAIPSGVASRGRGRVQQPDRVPVEGADHPLLDRGGRGGVDTVPQESEHDRPAGIAAVEGDDRLVVHPRREPRAPVVAGHRRGDRRPVRQCVGAEGREAHPDPTLAQRVVDVGDQPQHQPGDLAVDKVHLLTPVEVEGDPAVVAPLPAADWRPSIRALNCRAVPGVVDHVLGPGDGVGAVQVRTERAPSWTVRPARRSGRPTTAPSTSTRREAWLVSCSMALARAWASVVTTSSVTTSSRPVARARARVVVGQPDLGVVDGDRSRASAAWRCGPSRAR